MCVREGEREKERKRERNSDRFNGRAREKERGERETVQYRMKGGERKEINSERYIEQVKVNEREKYGEILRERERERERDRKE